MDKIINNYIYNLNYINKSVENICLILFLIILLYLIKIYKTNISEIKNKMLPVLIILFSITLSINTLGNYLNNAKENSINIEKNEIYLFDRIEEISKNNNSGDNPNSDKLPSLINRFSKESI